MITSITLRNFLSHRDTWLEFSPGVNVLVGPSDSGKSSVIRALRWVAENRPAGDEFRSHWAGTEPTIAEIIASGHAVGRIKGDGVNNYQLDLEVFKAFGQDVPEPVRRALALGPINVQYQLDGPFLLGDSPGAVARYLNQVVDLEEIDLALANAAAMKRQVDGAVREREARLAELGAAEAAFPDLAAAEEFVAHLEAAQARRAEVARARGRLSDLLEHIRDVHRGLLEAALPEGLEGRLSLLLDKAERLEAVRFTRRSLAALLRDMADVDGRMAQAGRVAGLSQRVGSLLARAREGAERNARRIKLQMALSEYHGVAARISGLAAIIEQGEERLRKGMPETCPLCGQPIGHLGRSKARGGPKSKN